MKIVCLHTAESNVAVFDDAAREAGLADGALLHHLRPDLLAAAEEAGGLTDDIETETAAVLRSLAQDADAVLLTCSTLGPAVDRSEQATSVPILRVDAALAERAAAAGGRIVALCAVETTLQPTERLFARATEASRTPCEIRLVPGAWASFKAGDREAYLSLVAAAAEDAYREGASIVALAQASMAGAAALVRGGPRPLTSPVAGLAAAADRISPHNS